MNCIIIDGDQARLYGVPKAIPTGQVGFSKIGFEFSPEWDGMTKIAQFVQGENKYNVAVENNECTCPNGLVKGWVSVRVRGYSETDVIATANEILLPVSKGFQSGGIPPIPPTPDLYQQFLKATQSQIGDLSDLTTEAKENLVTAINEAARTGGVQPDWNQNDATAADYIKNRPFYSETENVTVENATNVQLKGFPAFAIGDTVTVNVDGVEHSLVAYDDEGCVTIGDTTSSLENGEGQLGWQIYAEQDGGVMFSATEAHTVSYFSEIVVKIDEKYLPKGLIVNVVGTESNDGNTYLLFDKTDEEIYNAVNNGIAVTLELFGCNLQYIEDDAMFWGVAPHTSGTNGITKLKVLCVSPGYLGWVLDETYITASTDSNP